MAVNGTIEAVTRTFGHEGDAARFSAMVREGVFVTGRNLVEIFELRGRPQAPVMIPTRQPDSARFTLLEADGEEAIKSADGLLIPLVKGHLRGKAKLVRRTIGVRFSGWAAVRRGQQAARSLLVFIDGRLVMVVDNGLPSDDPRVKTMQPWRRAASFRFRLPDGIFAGTEEIRIIAVLGNAASEIRLLEQAKTPLAVTASNLVPGSLVPGSASRKEVRMD